jgi:folate-binding protein YgfZ
MLDANLQREYEALTQGCGFAELPRTLIAARGNDRAKFLNSFCTNDVKRLTAGESCEAFVTSHQGKLLGHVFIHCEAERLILDGVPGQAAALISHFEKYVVSEDVEFQDLSAALTTFAVAGARAASVLGQILGVEAPAAMCASQGARLLGVDVAARRVPCAGESSWFLQVPADESVAIAGALKGAGATRCSQDAIEILRLEAGFPAFGRDIGEENLPQEVGRDAQAISFKKGCYLGQETVARIDALGHVNRVLAEMQFSSQEVPAIGTALVAGEKEVGRVTSAVWSPRLGAPLGLAIVKRAQAPVGTRLNSAVGQAEIVRLPLAH